MEKVLYFEIFTKIKDSILCEQIKSGSKLPSVRHLMRKYKVSSKTVIKSLELLQKQGYIDIIPSVGSFVVKNKKYEITQTSDFILKNYQYMKQKIDGVINFACSEVSTTYFNKDLYCRLLKKVFLNKSFKFGEDRDIAGMKSLKMALSKWLEYDNIFTKEENLIIVSSKQQCLDIILKTFFDKKRFNIAISDPANYNVINLLQDFASIKGVHLMEDGWDFENFEKILKTDKIDFVYETPNFQDPSGITWSSDKKNYLLKLAKKYDFYIIEEDNHSHFFYESRKPSSLKSLDGRDNERVFYIKDFSKIIHPEIQVAVLIVPQKFKEKILIKKFSLGASSSNLSQKIVEIFIQDGYMQELVEETTKELKKRHDYMLTLLKKIPFLKVMSYPNGGFFFWIKFTFELDENMFYELCKEKGIILLPGYIFYQDYRKNSKFRLSFLGTNSNQIKKGIETIRVLSQNLLENRREKT